MSPETKTLVALTLIAFAIVVLVVWPVLRGWVARGPVLAERERCARLADAYIWELDSPDDEQLERERARHNHACEAIARMIRIRAGVAHVDR